MIFLEFGLLILGLVILVKGADWLVDGASSIAKIFKVPSILIGLTIVSFGTSAPELLTSITAVIQGSSDIALGNIIGSNITNILLILGVAAIINPLNLKDNTVWKEIPLAVLAAVLLFLFSVRDYLIGSLAEIKDLFQSTNPETQVGLLDRADGITLLLFFAIFMYYAFSLAKKGTEGKVAEDDIASLPMWKAGFLVIAGAVGLGLGSNLLIDNAIKIAQFFEISESLIGLTIIAFGTSVPELAATIAAATKKEADLAVGNIIGSNIFNIFFVLGSTLLVGNIPVTFDSIGDMLVLLLVTLMLFVAAFIFSYKKISRTEGYAMLTGYMFYFLYLLL